MRYQPLALPQAQRLLLLAEEVARKKQVRQSAKGPCTRLAASLLQLTPHSVWASFTRTSVGSMFTSALQPVVLLVSSFLSPPNASAEEQELQQRSRQRAAEVEAEANGRAAKRRGYGRLNHQVAGI